VTFNCRVYAYLEQTGPEDVKRLICFQVFNEIEADPTDEEPGTYRDSPAISSDCLNMDACNLGSPPDEYVDN
jgi:hypothetical protein